MSFVCSELRASMAPILERFDFKKVQSVMQFLGWTWAGCGGNPPTLEQLRETAVYVMESAIAEFENRNCPAGGMDCATGGFVARISVYAGGNQELELLFYVDYASKSSKIPAWPFRDEPAA